MKIFAGNEKIKLWIFNSPPKLQVLTNKEKYTLKNLKGLRAKRFSNSRTFIRESLSYFFNIEPLKIPLISPENRPPFLDGNLGNISLSYSKEIFIFGWSQTKIGLDIEHYKRKVNYELLIKKILNNKEHDSFYKSESQFNNLFLKYWVVKEAIFKHQQKSNLLNSRNWTWEIDSNIAFNDTTKTFLNIHQERFKDWEIAIASDNISLNFPFVCY